MHNDELEPSAEEGKSHYRQMVHQLRNHLASIEMAAYLLGQNPTEENFKTIVGTLAQESSQARQCFESLIIEVDARMPPSFEGEN